MVNVVVVHPSYLIGPCDPLTERLLLAGCELVTDLRVPVDYAYLVPADRRDEHPADVALETMHPFA